MRGAPGTTCKLYMDLAGGGPGPIEGDFIRTEAGSCYQVNEVHEGRRRGRFHMRVTRLGLDAVADGEPGVWTIRWHRR